MPGHVFLTGGSGFVGSFVIDELVRRGWDVNALVHRGAIANPSVRSISGDLFNAPALEQGIRGCDAIVHLVGIIEERPSKGITFERIHVEGTRSVVDAAGRNQVRRLIHMSALGTRPDAVSQYHRTKWLAEEYVRASGLDWTILRPSLIHGPGGFMKMEAAWARKSAPPFVAMPYFGGGILGLGGAGLLQPIYVGDVARAFVDALEKPRSIGRTYELAGPERLTWPEFHRAAAIGIVKHRRLTSPMPVWVAKLLAGAGLGRMLGFNRDQVIMSQEDNIADIAPFERDFGWMPRGFEATLAEYGPNL